MAENIQPKATINNTEKTTPNRFATLKEKVVAYSFVCFFVFFAFFSSNFPVNKCTAFNLRIGLII